MRRGVLFLMPLLILAFLVTAGTQQAAAQSKTVSILATWGGDEETGFREVLDAFTKASGIAYKSWPTRASRWTITPAC
jgi:alpha-glucoside transport system substrate-binding protein